MTTLDQLQDKKFMKYFYSVVDTECSIEKTWVKIVWHTSYFAFKVFINLLVINELRPINFELEPAEYKSWHAVPFLYAVIQTFQAVFLILAFIHDIYEWRDAQESPRAKKIAYWRDVIFQSMVVPYTLFVSSMFWSLYLYDRELVFPKVYDVILPWWFNHCVHTNITIIVAVETVLQARRHPVNIKLELILTTVINVAYAVVYYSIYFFAHRWLYNIFGVLNWWQVILYQIGIWSSAYFFYYIQFPINRLFHGSEPEVEKTVEVRDAVEKTPEVETKVGSDIAKNFEIASMQKTESDTPFSSENWSLKYRSLREKFENSRL